MLLYQVHIAQSISWLDVGYSEAFLVSHRMDTQGSGRNLLVEIVGGLHELHFNSRAGITTGSKFGNCVYRPIYCTSFSNYTA